MKLAEAKQIADGIISRITPYCEPDYCRVVGSIRRADKPEVKDIELIVCAKWEKQLTEAGDGNLFGEVVSVNLLHEWATKKSGIRWIKPGVKEIIDWPIKPDGKYWRALIPVEATLCTREELKGPNETVCHQAGFDLIPCSLPHSQPKNYGIKLDLFLATAFNFGLLFMIRTGPDYFSKEIVTQQHKGGLLPDEYRVSKGQLWEGENVIETPTEQAVFDILGIPFLSPAERGLRRRMPIMTGAEDSKSEVPETPAPDDLEE